MYSLENESEWITLALDIILDVKYIWGDIFKIYHFEKIRSYIFQTKKCFCPVHESTKQP